MPRRWSSAPEDIAEVADAQADPDSYYWGPAPELIAFVRNRTPRDLFKGESEELESCFTDRAIAEQLRYRVIGGGDIMFTLSGFPHVASVCNGDLFSASLAELKPFLASSAINYFPVLGVKPEQ